MRILLGLVCLCVLPLWTGCDDNVATPTNPILTDMRDMEVPIGGSNGTGGMMGDDMVMPVKESRELRIEGAPNQTIFFNQTVDLAVRYVARRDGQETFLPNETISLRLLDSTDTPQAVIQGCELQSSTVNTNGQGIGTFRLFTSSTEVSFKIEATAPDAPPVYFRISVLQPGTGDLTVKVLYDVQRGRYTYQNLEIANVSLFRADGTRSTCDQIIADATNLRGSYFAFPSLTPFDDVNNTFTQGDFAHGATFTVAGTVNSISGQAVGFACVEDVTIVGGEQVEVDLDITDLPLQFKGKFVTTNRFDLTDLMRTSQDETLNVIVDVLDILQALGSDDQNRGAELIRLICDIANVQGDICNVGAQIANTLVIGLINELDPDILNALTVISDVINILTETTIIGEIEFTENYPDEENMIRNSDNRWLRFRFNWRDDCMANECEREFTIGNIDTLARPIAGIFDATIEEQQLKISEHGMTFRYGLIILGLAETWVIPAVLNQPGPVSLNDLISELMEGICPEIDMLSGQMGFCDSVIVTALSAVIVDQLGRLEFDPDQFRLRGYATMVDDNQDLRVDRMVDGVWCGSVDLGSSQVGFNGCFVGCRDAECEGEANECLISMDLSVCEEMENSDSMEIMEMSSN
jgi:hypothetical protein